MKSKLLPVFCLLIFALSASSAFAQNGKCDRIYVDVKKGTINKLKPNAPMEKIQAAFPCYTGITKEDEGYNCGGGVFFIGHDFYAYTGRDYWEIRGKFDGTWSDKLIGLRPTDLEFRFGDPVREEKIPGYKVLFYKQKYGCLRVQYNVQTGRSEEIGMHYQSADKVELCY